MYESPYVSDILSHTSSVLTLFLGRPKPLSLRTLQYQRSQLPKHPIRPLANQDYQLLGAHRQEGGRILVAEVVPAGWLERGAVALDEVRRAIDY